LQALLTRAADATADSRMAAVAVLVCAQVLVRYVLGGSLVWSEELTRLAFVWMVLVAVTSSRPMRVEFFVELLPRRLKAFVLLLAELLVLSLVLLLMYGAWGMMDLTRYDTYTSLGISVMWLHAALFVATILWVARSLFDLRSLLADLRQ
jgi:TRAP-type transport system small permease protein